MSARLQVERDIAAVVLGASSGGVEALMTVLPALRTQAQVSAMVVLHLPRDRGSLLPEIFRPRCALAIEEGADKDEVRPGHIYFAPPDYHLLIDHGPTLALSRDEPVQYSRPSIDVLFESAADIYGERLLAVLLTGAGSDGSAGMRMVQERGGVTVVQEPGSAQVAAMPESALRAMTPDFQLPLEGIASLLRSLNTEVCA